MATETLTSPTSTTSRGDTKVMGARAQFGNLQVLKYVSDSILAAGNSELNLTTAFDSNYVMIKQIVVAASASTDFDIEIYPDDQFTANTFVYQNINNNLVMNDMPLGGLAYVDMDSTKELHLKIINTDAGNASTFTIFVYLSPVSNA